MRKLSTATSLAVVIAFSTSFVASWWVVSVADDADGNRLQAADPVIASFERELNHAPAKPVAARREAIDNDVLYRSMNKIHWTGHSAGKAEKAQEKNDEQE